jgi:hypothetical protein
MATKKKTPAQLKVEADARARAASAKKRAPDLATAIVRTNLANMPAPKPKTTKKPKTTNVIQTGMNQLSDAAKAFWGPRLPILEQVLGKKKKK